MSGLQHNVTGIIMPGTPTAGQLFQTDATNKLVAIPTAGSADGWVVSRNATTGLYELRAAGAGGGLPTGGATGEVLTKLSGADNDADWVPIGLTALGGYDPEAPPVGQAAPSVELDFKTLTAFPSGWSNIGAGGFTAHDINATRPGALWAKSTAGEAAFRGKDNPLIAAGQDFCVLWRPWITTQNSNFGLMAVAISTIAGLTGNVLFGWHGRHGSYGAGTTYGWERSGATTGTAAAWNMDSGTTRTAWFMRMRRVGTTIYYGISPDGSYWQEVSSTGETLSSAAVYVAIALYGSNSVESEGGLSVFRLWLGDGSAKRSGALSVAGGSSSSGGSGGGMIGSAAFNPSSGTIAGLAMTGIVSGVTRTAAGRFTVAFTAAEADANYIVSAIASDDSAAAKASFLGGVASDYTTTGFKLVTATIASSPTAVDPQVVRFAIFRYGGSGGGGGGASTKFSLGFQFSAASQYFDLPVGDYAATIKGWGSRLNVSGSASFTVERATTITGSYSDMPGSAADPTVASAIGAEDTDLTDWAIQSLGAKSVLRVSCATLTTAAQATLTLHFERT